MMNNLPNAPSQTAPASTALRSRRICLVSPGHIASNPRLVKEADALHQAGYQVRVVAGDYMAAIRPLDQTILSQSSWQYTKVDLGSPMGHGLRRIRQEIARQLAQAGILSLPVATWAHSPISIRLAKVAASEPADLYIGHCLAALPAVAYAARVHGARFGFDAEDYHVGELKETPDHRTEIAVRDCLERSLLQHCHHSTAASPGIAAAYAARYGVAMQSILNVFPLSEAPSSPPKLQVRMSQEPSLYWFSQTIGPGRGIESIVQALGKMDNPVQLYLRGISAVGYAEHLTCLAQEIGVNHRVHLLPPAPPSDMAQLAASYDLGLSIEPGRDVNNSICLGNKIFTYLLAGLPVVLSKTPSQEELAKELGEAALLIDIHDPTSIAIALDAFFSEPIKLEKARARAWKLGQERYNWNVEQKYFLESVESALT